MSLIRSKDTKPEMIVRKYLHGNGFRFRLHDKKLPGRPDLTLRKYNIAIYVNGCFWHGHSKCKYHVLPKTNNSYWLEKIKNNRQRDLRSAKLLEALGWKVIVIWECQIRESTKIQTLESLRQKISY